MRAHTKLEPEPDIEDTALLVSWNRTTDRPSGSNTHAVSADHSRPSPLCKLGTATHTAPTPPPAPGLPRAAPGRPRAPPRCARGSRRRETAARGRRRSPSGATAGASALPPAPLPPRARSGWSCTPFGGLDRASRCVGTRSYSTYGRESRPRAAPDPRAGAHCVVPQGQLSLAFSPQMVQVKRSRNSLARAFLASYSFTFSTYSCFITCRGGKAWGKCGGAGSAGGRIRHYLQPCSRRGGEHQCIQKKQAI